MNRALMEVVVDAMLFVGHRSDEVVEPDAAVDFLEGVAASLKAPTPRELAELEAYFTGRARIASACGLFAFAATPNSRPPCALERARLESDPERKKFLQRLLVDAGLRDEAPPLPR